MMSGKRHRRTGGRGRSSYGRRTIAPVAELATKAPRGDARGTLGPARAVRSDDLVGSTPYQDCSWNPSGNTCLPTRPSRLTNRDQGDTLTHGLRSTPLVLGPLRPLAWPISLEIAKLPSNNVVTIRRLLHHCYNPKIGFVTGLWYVPVPWYWECQRATLWPGGGTNKNQRVNEKSVVHVGLPPRRGP